MEKQGSGFSEDDAAWFDKLQRRVRELDQEETDNGLKKDGKRRIFEAASVDLGVKKNLRKTVP